MALAVANIVLAVLTLVWNAAFYANADADPAMFRLSHVIARPQVAGVVASCRPPAAHMAVDRTRAGRSV